MYNVCPPVEFKINCRLVAGGCTPTDQSHLCKHTARFPCLYMLTKYNLQAGGMHSICTLNSYTALFTKPSQYQM